MINSDITASLRVLAQLANVNPSTVSRYISASKITPIDPNSKKHKYTYNDCRLVLRELYAKHKKLKHKVHCFYNFKGGTGKTSLCYQIATHLALCGFKVLAIDADPQAHLSTLFGFNSMDDFLTLYDVVAENIPLKQAIQPIQEGLDCIPSNLSLTKISLPLDQMPKREEILKNIFQPIEKEYDFIIFDTNPTISTLNRNIVVYSDIINVVCETQPLSINGLKILFDDLQKFYNLMRMKIPKMFIIPNKYEDKSGSSAESMTALRLYYEKYLKPDFAVRKSEDINSSAKYGLPLATFVRKNSNALEDIVELLGHFVDNSCEE
jgi:chromosome partitioning protein